MMRKVLHRLAGYLLPAFLVLIALFLAWKNYSSGSYFIGWDSIHPEFNFNLNIERMISGVWREDQGLGTIAAHAHMADLPRVAILWLISSFVPDSLLRYISIFSCLIIGPLGMYYLLKHAFQGKNVVTLMAAFLGGLFYLLNLVTLQQFTVPFEMFAVSYAALPWIFYSTFRYLNEEKRINLIFFAIVVLLSAPMAYASAQFFAFLACFLIFLVIFAFLNKLKTLKKSLVLVVVLLLVNSFWLLPNLYSIFTQANVIENSKINLLFSPEAFLRNQDYGNDLKNLVTGKNFLFSWFGYDFKSKEFVQILDIWNKHLDSKTVQNIGYALAGCSVIGILFSIFKKNKAGIALLGTLAVSLFFLININPPTGDIYAFFYNNIAIFREGFRMPFTKFSIPFLLAASYYFGYFFFGLFEILRKNKVFWILIFVGFLSTIFGLIYFMKPAFEGHLISSVVEQKLPSDYQKTFDWFKGTKGRIARLPLNTVWGWDYQSWGYQGSGFLGYGLLNPLLVRDYDRWSQNNESFYNQASLALYSNDKESLEKTFEKYQVKYLILDESIENAGGSNDILYISEIKKMLEISSHIQEKAKFGFITIYETYFNGSPVVTPKSYAPLNVNLDYAQKDFVYSGFGDYVETKDKASYPFVNFDSRSGVVMYETNDTLIFENKNNNLKVSLPIKDRITESFDTNRGFENAYNCDLKKAGQVEKQELERGRIYKASNGSVACDFFLYPDLAYSQGFVLRIKGKNLEGRSLKIYLQNTETNRMDIEELLPTGDFDSYFVILPKKLDGSGYALNVETRSFGRISSQNRIDLIELTQISVDELYSLKSIDTEPQTIKNEITVDSVNKIGTWFYNVKVTGSGLFVLNQGYEDGWIAVSGSKVLPHTKVNSWANGWVTGGSGDVYIVFWPQLLEYLGFGLVLAAFSLILTSKAKKGSI